MDQKKRALDEGPFRLPVVTRQSKYIRSVNPYVRGWFG